MSTMDIIKLHGGEPANFLNLQGSAIQDQIDQGFKIITSDPKVECVLITFLADHAVCDRRDAFVPTVHVFRHLVLSGVTRSLLLLYKPLRN